MRDALSWTDLCRCTNFLPNPFSSFGRQTERQTDGIFNIPTTTWEIKIARKDMNITSYIKDAVTPISQDPTRRRLRSADTTDYAVPRTRTKFGDRDRAFCVAGLSTWNSLPESLRRTDCTEAFKRRLKTHFLTSTSALFCFNFHCFIDSCKPVPVALLVASRYELPGYGDRRLWVRGPGWPDIVSGYSGVCFEIKLSGRHRGFNGVLYFVCAPRRESHVSLSAVRICRFLCILERSANSD